MPPGFYDRWPILKQWYNILTTSKDRDGIEYISTMEAKKYPFTGVEAMLCVKSVFRLFLFLTQSCIDAGGVLLHKHSWMWALAACAQDQSSPHVDTPCETPVVERPPILLHSYAFFPNRPCRHPVAPREAHQ